MSKGLCFFFFSFLLISKRNLLLEIRLFVFSFGDELFLNFFKKTYESKKPKYLAFSKLKKKKSHQLPTSTCDSSLLNGPIGVRGHLALGLVALFWVHFGFEAASNASIIATLFTHYVPHMRLIKGNSCLQHLYI